MTTLDGNKVFLKYTEGCCWRRVLDAEVLQHYFQRNEWEVVNDPAKADLNVVVTCAFVKLTEELSVRDIKDLQGLQGNILVSGCLPAINKKRLDAFYQGPRLAAKDIGQIDQLFPQHLVPIANIEDANFLLEQQKKFGAASVTAVRFLTFLATYARWRPSFYRNLWRNVRAIRSSRFGLVRKVYYLRVGWGCGEPHCTFCLEWLAVGGKFISKPISALLAEAEQGLRQGYRDFVVVSDNPGGYGSDLGSSIAELLRELLKLSPELTISSIDGFHPYWIIKYLDELVPLVETRRIKFIMTPLQSGSDRILGLMNRRYTAGQMSEALAKLSRADPTIRFTSQAIIGFPTETEQDFQDTLRAIKKMDFLNITLFPYCRNDITPSASMEPQIPPEVTADRMKRARDFVGRNAIFSFQLGLDIQGRFHKGGQELVE